MNEVARAITNESKIVFTDGTIYEGAEEVMKLVLTACEVYNTAYMREYNKIMLRYFGRGLLIGAVAGGTYLILREIKKES
jgi:hypothetical protein